jgi:hypothetical protein
VTAVEPVPPDELRALAREHPELELVEETSLEALERIELADAIILDGDHNYYTVSNELRLIGERSPQGLPLLIFHDVGWPLGRRDAYEAPDQIPPEHRQPIARNAGLSPGEPGVVSGGLFYSDVAAREGGPRNGVLTAIEDFQAAREGLRLAVIPAFFGMGVMWETRAPWADRVAAIVDPWDGNPMLERLEMNRLTHLIGRLDLDHELDEERGVRRDGIEPEPAARSGRLLGRLRNRG